MPFLSSAHATVIKNSCLFELNAGDAIFHENRFGESYEVHVEHACQQESGLDQLRRHTLLAGLHDSQMRPDPSRCYPGTRSSMLKAINRWANDAHSPQQKPCLWLSGPVGAGKSAIAQTLAEAWHEQHLLAAALFVPRAPTSSAEKHTAITTIAYQLAVRLPHLRAHLERAIKNDPLIFTKSYQSQIEELIVQPFRQVYRINPFIRSTTHIILIDGLDEWRTNQDEGKLLSLLLDMLLKTELPLVLLITSRPEPHISEVFDNLPDPNSVLQLVLDGDFSPQADIELYIRERLNQLKSSRYQVVGPSWPPEDAISIILAKSSGQFLYASAVVEHICRSRGDAQRLLRAIVEGSQDGDSPLSEVDTVLKQLLESVASTSRETVMEILAWLSVYRHTDILIDDTLARLVGDETQLPLSPPWFECILALQPGELYTHLVSLHSLLNIPGRGTHQPLSVYHECLFGFLSNPARAGPFAMDTPKAHGRIARCLSRHLVSTPPENLSQLDAVEDCFRFHLRLSHLATDLQKDVSVLLQNQSNIREAGTGATHRTPMPSLACDTKRAILYYIKKCNEADQNQIA